MIRPLLRTLTGAALIALAGLAPVSASAQEKNSAAASAEARQLREQIRTDALAPVAGTRNGDVTVVLFSDYQCPYCRRFNSTLDALIAADPKVRVVYRDWPIQGQASVLAARAAIAAQYQNRHHAMHTELMSGPVRLDAASVKLAARNAKVDWNRLQADMKTHKDEIDALLVRNYRFAKIMGLEGTPGMLVGTYVVPGAADLKTMQQAVARARKANEG